MDLKIKQNPPKSCQIIGGEGGGGQARLLKSGMILDDPFPHLFGLFLSPIDYRIASVVPLLNIGDQNVRIRVIM